MNDHDAERIAAAIHQARPDWPSSSLLTFLHKHLLSRPRRDVLVALAWVASEPNSLTPARVLEDGPWWKAAGISGDTVARESIGRAERCSICSERRDRCRQRWTDDHAFASMATAAARKAESNPAAVTSAVAALKGLVAPTAEPDTRKGLEDMANRNPKLRARVDALRAQVPGLATPELREPVTTTQPEGDPQ